MNIDPYPIGLYRAKPKTMNKEESNVYKWVIIENIVIAILTAGLFVYTKSAWSFLLMLGLNSIKRSTKTN